MSDITIHLNKKQAEGILKVLGGRRWYRRDADEDALQEFLQTLSDKLYALDARAQKKNKK
jgi:hypothetical protein